MDRVIKEIKNGNLVYKLGYLLFSREIYPCIEIYKNGKSFSGGYWNNGNDEMLFHFDTNYDSYYDSGYIGTIKGMFNKLRENISIPEEVEKEYENMFIIYKLNDFKELTINT